MLCVSLSGGCKKTSEQSEKTAEAETQKRDTKAGAQDEVSKTSTTPTPSGAPVEMIVIEEQPARAMSDKSAADLVEHSRSVVTALGGALAAIDEQRLDDAKSQLGRATADLDKLASERPVIEVAVELWRKRQQLELVELERSVDTMPLLATLTRVDVPVYERASVEARHAQRMGQGAETVAKQDKSSDLAFVDSKLVYLEVDMPITATRIEVDDARRLLDEGKPAEAKLALERAMGSIDVFEVVTEAPEYRARALVWAAENAFVAGDITESGRLLDEAADMVAPIAKQQDDPEARVMATMLLTQMQPLQAALRSGESDKATGFHRLARNVSSFSRRAALQVLMGRHFAAEHLALADALMWLEKAETEGVAKPAGDPAATADLARAAEALARAKPLAPPSAAGNLEDLHSRARRLAELDHAPARDGAAIESMLRGVMFDLRMLSLEIGTAPPSSAAEGPV